MARPCASVPVGAKPPWNHPQVTLLAFSKSPTLVPVAVIMFVPCSLGLVTTQSSYPGRGSPITEPRVAPLAMLPDALAGLLLGRRATSVAPKVLPEIKFSAPGVEGP
jgi:hypothetical protein